MSRRNRRGKILDKDKFSRSSKSDLQVKNSYAIQSDIEWTIPDILLEIEKKTQLTRQTIFEILEKSERIDEIAHNPQRFIDLASEKIQAALHDLMIGGIEYFRLPELFPTTNQAKGTQPWLLLNKKTLFKVSPMPSNS